MHSKMLQKVAILCDFWCVMCRCFEGQRLQRAQQRHHESSDSNEVKTSESQHVRLLAAAT
jgi:hypothetical protein